MNASTKRLRKSTLCFQRRGGFWDSTEFFLTRCHLLAKGGAPAMPLFSFTPRRQQFRCEERDPQEPTSAYRYCRVTLRWLIENLSRWRIRKSEVKVVWQHRSVK